MILGSSLSLHKATDFIALVKPRVTALVIATTLAGIWLAPGTPSAFLVLATLLGSVLLVGAANTLNMYLERDLDGLMHRTRNRPLPAKRLSPEVALWFGIILASISIATLTFAVNPLTGLLGVIAFVSYVWFYTPLKQKSHAALLIGAIPGAMPPLMGWTAVTNSIRYPHDLMGLILFAILFLWQIPHFLAIALFRKEDYQKAGIRIMPLEKGEAATKHMIVRYLAGLVAVSFYPVLFGMTGSLYLGTSLVLGAIFFAVGLWGFKKSMKESWAKFLFFVSIVYLPVLLFVLVINS